MACVLDTQMGHVSPFLTSTFQELSNDIKTFHFNEFRPLKSLFKNLRVHRNSNSQNESSLGNVEGMNVEVHSLTLSYTPRSMRYDSRASLLARTFTNLYKPKVKVATCCVDNNDDIHPKHWSSH
jgi:hypothetical protein